MPTLSQPNSERSQAAATFPEGEPDGQQYPAPHARSSAKAAAMTVTTILAIIGGIALVLTAAARIPTALAELLRASIQLVAAARELRNALDGGTHELASDEAHDGDHGRDSDMDPPH